MRIKITADSTCDLPPALIAEHNISVIPLTVIKDGVSHLDGVDLTPADIFAHVAAGGELCTTTAVNVGEYRTLFEKYSGQYDAVVHINLSAEISCSHQNALLAAADFPNVHVIDSRNLSTGQGYVVLEACRRAKECEDVTVLCDALRALTKRVESSFLLDHLDYLAKGGRCSSLMALGANLLKLRPCIEVKDGKMQVGKKYRGKQEKCLSEYVQDRLDGRQDIDWSVLFFTHTPLSPTAMTAAQTAVEEFGRYKTVYTAMAGCTISCHCGPGTFGLMFLRKE